MKSKTLRQQTLVDKVYAQPVMFIGTEDQELDRKPENMRYAFEAKMAKTQKKSKQNNKLKG